MKEHELQAMYARLLRVEKKVDLAINTLRGICDAAGRRYEVHYIDQKEDDINKIEYRKMLDQD